mgnify:FL=1
MSRPSFTIIDNRDISYDGNHLAFVTEDGTGRWMFSFVCSGHMTLLPVDELKEIRFSAEGTYWCGVCEQPLKT